MIGTTQRALRRVVAGGASAAIAVAGLTLGLAAPAHAVPVTVSGTLTDGYGNALDGYVTSSVLQPGGTYSFGPSQEIVDGVVALSVEPGTYKFQFFDEYDNFVSEYYNDKTTFETADAVVVAGPVTLAPVALGIRPAFTGQVVSPSGKPLEDAQVSIVDQTTGNTVNSSETRPDGTYRVAAAPGTYKVRISKSGYVAEFYNNQPTLAAASPVTLGTADAALFTVGLQRGAVVTGLVTNAANVGLERVSVTLTSAAPGGGSSYTDYTDPAGNVRIEGVAPGNYKASFTDPLGEYLPEWFTDKPDMATADVITVGLEPVAGLNAALAPDPTNVPADPATVELSGVVNDSAGRPVVGARVQVWDTPADGDRRNVVETVVTNRAGGYAFDSLDQTSESAFKVFAQDQYPVEEGSYARMSRWFGGAQSYAGASVVAKPTVGAIITLPLTGGISGAVTSEVGLPVDTVAVSFFDATGNPDAQSGSAFVEENGTYATTFLAPGTYKVLFSGGGQGFSYDNGVFSHAPEWYDDTTFAKAKTITVKSGQTVTGINAALSQDLKAVRKPEINGKPYLDGKLRAYPGVWSVESNTSYLYEWLIGTTVVGTGPTYKVTGAAKNKRVTLRVLAENQSLSGTALVSTQVIKKKPKVKVTVKGSKAKITVSGKKIKPKKIKGKIVVKKIVRTDEYGAPVYKAIGKGKLANGQASVTLKKLSKGKNKLVFFITLKGGKLGDATIAKTIKFKR